MFHRHHPDDAQTDAELAARVQRGDPHAYAALFRAYYLSIVRFLTRYLTPHESAEDVAQDVFAQLWERRLELDPGRSVKAYLFTTARNRAFDLLAHRDVVRRHEETSRQALGDTMEVAADPRPDEIVTAAELAHIAEQRVATLSPRLREVYHLSRDEGLSAAEIATVLGTSVQTIYTQLTKVTQALHPVLERWLDD